MAASSSPADSAQQRFHQRQHQEAAEHMPFRLFGTTISTACSADSDSDRDSTTKSQAEEQPTTESMENSNDLEGESSDNDPPHHHQTKLSCRKRRSCERTPVKKPDKLIPCPRCDSLDTKFCYYNNYNVNQPRHFCKNCQRYWTAGGTLRNVPVGAGRRKNKHNNNNNNHNTTNNNTSSNNITNLALGATSSPSTIHGSHQCFSPVISFGLEKSQNTTTAGDHHNHHHHLGSSASRITEVLLSKAMRQSEINELKGKEEVSSSSNEWWINIMKAAAASKTSSGGCSSSSSWPVQRRRDDPYPRQQQQQQPIHYQFFKIHHQSSPSSTAAVHAGNSSSVLTSSANLYLSSSDNCPISVFPDKKPEEASSIVSCFESFHEHSNPSFPR